MPGSRSGSPRTRIWTCRRALTDFFQSHMRPAMMKQPENEKDVQDTVEALLIGRGLQKGQEYDRETGRVKMSSSPIWNQCYRKR